MPSEKTYKLGIPKEAFTTGIADARTFNAAMDLIDDILGSAGDGHWKAPVATFGDLPPTGNVLGDARVATSTADVWMWDGAAWKKSNRAIIYRGVWDANANVPPLASGVGNQGDYYVVGVSGNTNLDGITDWVVGDWAVFNGTVWEKADHTDAVASVFGRKGAVTAQAGDYTHAQLAGIGANDHHNRQHALDSAADHTGTITDTQHGSRSGGNLHSIVTPDPGGVAGFMSPADKAKSNLLMPPATDAVNAAPTEAVLIAASWVAGSYGFYRTTLNNKSWLVWYRVAGGVDYVQL